jgi:hypothetical protein
MDILSANSLYKTCLPMYSVVQTTTELLARGGDHLRNRFSLWFPDKCIRGGISAGRVYAHMISGPSDSSRGWPQNHRASRLSG